FDSQKSGLSNSQSSKTSSIGQSSGVKSNLVESQIMTDDLEQNAKLDLSKLGSEQSQIMEESAILNHETPTIDQSSLQANTFIQNSKNQDPRGYQSAMNAQKDFNQSFRMNNSDSILRNQNQQQNNSKVSLNLNQRQGAGVSSSSLSEDSQLNKSHRLYNDFKINGNTVQYMGETNLQGDNEITNSQFNNYYDNMKDSEIKNYLDNLSSVKNRQNSISHSDMEDYMKNSFFDDVRDKTNSNNDFAINQERSNNVNQNINNSNATSIHFSNVKEKNNQDKKIPGHDLQSNGHDRVELYNPERARKQDFDHMRKGNNMNKVLNAMKGKKLTIAGQGVNEFYKNQDDKVIQGLDMEDGFFERISKRSQKRNSMADKMRNSHDPKLQPNENNRVELYNRVQERKQDFDHIPKGNSMNTVLNRMSNQQTAIKFDLEKSTSKSRLISNNTANRSSLLNNSRTTGGQSK
ncbi:MAG: hypothetical protein AAFO15_00740, partial [Pseudomonadota bacterium]